jgi:hypothetical protein
MKTDYFIDRVGKEEIKNLLYTYHYLKDESKDFKSGYNYGLFSSSSTDILHVGGCLACCVFTKIPVPEIAVGAFGLERHEQEGLYELSRLCVHPDLQKTEYNITSWFVSRCIKRFRKDARVRCILSYADSNHHSGVIYRACNFSYYGLTDSKKDFYYADGTKHSRGSVKGLEGEWRDRSRKHRYLMVFDKNLKKRLTWKEEKWYNNQDDTNSSQ